MDIFGLARDAGFTLTNGSYWKNVKGTDAELRKFAEMIAAAERERCAKLCEAQRDPWAAAGYEDAVQDCAAAIRAS